MPIRVIHHQCIGHLPVLKTPVYRAFNPDTGETLDYDHTVSGLLHRVVNREKVKSPGMEWPDRAPSCKDAESARRMAEYYQWCKDTLPTTHSQAGFVVDGNEEYPQDFVKEDSGGYVPVAVAERMELGLREALAMTSNRDLGLRQTILKALGYT